MPYVRPNNQGTRSGPERGGVAARPAKPVGGPTERSLPVTPQGGGGFMPPDLMATVEKLKASPTFQAQVMGGANPQQAATAAGAAPLPGGAGGPGGDPGAMPAGKPAWQQLQEIGIGGQGSAQANKAMLAERQAAQPSPGGIPVGAQPMPGGAPPSGGIMDPGQVRNAVMDSQPNPGLFGGGNMGVRNRMKQNLMAQRQPAAPAPQPRSPMPVQNVPAEQSIAGPFQRPGVGRASMPMPQTLRR